MFVPNPNQSALGVESDYFTHSKPIKKKPTKPRQPKLGLIRDIEKMWDRAKDIIDEYQLEEMTDDEYKKDLQENVVIKSDAFSKANADYKVASDKFQPVNSAYQIVKLENDKIEDELEKLEREILQCD